MYIVKIKNGNIEKTIHGRKDKLKSGTITKGINAIDSFSFSLLPDNPGFYEINEFTTYVEVYNTNKERYDFVGRVLYAETTMDESGLITKSVTCESVFGYFCDSIQTYVETQNWTVSGLLQQLIDCHNSQLEEYKHFKVGTVTASDSNDNLYQAIQRENTWNAIKSKLIDKIGGEICFRIEEDGIYIDYLERLGEVKDTPIALSLNMKAMTKEQNPSDFVTRLIPLGCKLKDDDGNDTEQRLDITSVNDGLNYIDDEEAVALYGIHVGVAEWDDVTEAQNLYDKGYAWFGENNKVQVKYSITALDLSLIGIVLDDLDVGNTHPIQNGLIGVNDSARIIKKNIDVCDETSSTIEIGDNFKSLSDIQLEQSNKVNSVANTVSRIESDYITNERLISESLSLNSLIQQTTQSILLTVSETYESITTSEEFKKIVESELRLLADQMSLWFTETNEGIEAVNSDLQEKFNTITTYFTFEVDGFTVGRVGNPNKIVIEHDDITIYASGRPVQEFKADGSSLIPILNVTKMLNVVGLQISKDANHINCDYIEG